MAIEVIDLSGAVGECERCRIPLRVAGERNAEASMLRLAKAPTGYCIDCAVREWFYVMRDAIRDLDPKELRHPWIQEQYGKIMKVANSDARPQEINWEKVIADWDLPLKGARKPRRKAGPL